MSIHLKDIEGYNFKEEMLACFTCFDDTDRKEKTVPVLTIEITEDFWPDTECSGYLEAPLKQILEHALQSCNEDVDKSKIAALFQEYAIKFREVSNVS